MQKHPFHLLFFFGGFADVGGIESFASDLLHAIRERFTRISLLCYAKPNNPLIEQLRTVEISIRNSTWRWGCKWSIPELVLIVLGLPTLHCADLIVFGKPFSPWVLRILNAAAGLGRKKRAPFLLVIPYKPCDLWRDSRRAQALQYYDKILVQAKTFEQDLRDLGYTGEVNILPYVPPHSPHRVTPLPISDPLRLGFLGRLEAQKNLPFLLEVFRAVLSHVSVDLHLFGTGSEQARLIRQVESCQLTGRVFFHGHVPREEVLSKVDSCALFLFTSVTEGQCLAALEILSRGRPLLATPAGALPEILATPGLGHLLSSDSSDTAAATVCDAIAKVTSGKWTAETVIAAYRAKFGPEDVVCRYVELFLSTRNICRVPAPPGCELTDANCSPSITHE